MLPGSGDNLDHREYRDQNLDYGFISNAVLREPKISAVRLALDRFRPCLRCGFSVAKSPTVSPLGEDMEPSTARKLRLACRIYHRNQCCQRIDRYWHPLAANAHGVESSDGKIEKDRVDLYLWVGDNVSYVYVGCVSE